MMVTTAAQLSASRERVNDVRIMLVGGGTAGHVTPLLAVAEELRETGLVPENMLFVGTSANVEQQMILAKGFSFEAIHARGFVYRGVIGGAISIALSLASTIRVWQIIRRWQPSILVLTGGYVSVPAILAGRVAGKPSVCILPDAEPGLAVRLAARLGSQITASWSEGTLSLPRDRLHITGYPLRRSLLRWNRKSAREEFGIDANEPVIAILGGSRGSLRLNIAVKEDLPQILGLGILIHATGPDHFDDASAARGRLSDELQSRYLVAPRFDNNYGAVLAASDLAISRAGASVIGEFPAFGLPSMLVPGDFAGGHQWVNARILSDSGAAEILSDTEVSGRRIIEMASELLRDPDRLRSMREASSRLARPDAAAKIADIVLALAAEGEIAIA